jgi:hypothetical protein
MTTINGGLSLVARSVVGALLAICLSLLAWSVMGERSARS